MALHRKYKRVSDPEILPLNGGESTKGLESGAQNNCMMIIILYSIVFSFIGMFILCLVLFYLTLYGMRELGIDYYDPRRFPTNKHITHQNVVLIGDSLIGYPGRFNDLGDKVSDRISMYGYTNATVSYKGPRAYGVSDWYFLINQTLTQTATSPPDIVIFYTDSDLTKIVQHDFHMYDIDRMKEQYIHSFRLFVEEVLSSGAYLIVSGPGVYGDEGFLGKPRRYRGWHNRRLWDDYRDINQQLCQEYDIPYIDLRQILIDSIPWYWVWYCGYITHDGEHANERSARIIADTFALAIKNRLNSVFQ